MSDSELNLSSGPRTSVTRRLTFCAGHRLLDHEGKCKHPHGHNYVALITVVAEGENELDTKGRVVDFSVIKERIGGWIDRNWDHQFIVNGSDQVLRDFLDMEGCNHFVLPPYYNPTAEVMAAHLLDNVCPQMLRGTGCRAVQVELEETENCVAIVHD